MSDWGRRMFVSPGIVVDGRLVHNDLVAINLGIRVLLGRSFYVDWTDRERFVTHDPLGNPVDQRHPVEPAHDPEAGQADFDGEYSWAMSPRWFDGTDHLALDTGGGPLARLWATALGSLVDFGYVTSTGHSVLINLPRTVTRPEVTLEWAIPRWSNALERNRARTYFQAYAAACALHFVEQALAEVRAGRTATWTPFTVPSDADSVGFAEAVRGALSHHMVIRDGRIANYHRTRRRPGTAASGIRTARPARTRTRCRTRRSSRRTRRRRSRASTSCVRCAASIRACRAGCTCTSAAAGSSTANTPRWAPQYRREGPTVTGADAAHGGSRNAVDRLLAELSAADPRAAAAAEELTAAWSSCTAPAWTRIVERRRGLNAVSSCAPTRWWRACCWCTTCIPWTRTPDPARPAYLSGELEYAASTRRVSSTAPDRRRLRVGRRATVDRIEAIVRQAAPEVAGIDGGHSASAHCRCCRCRGGRTQTVRSGLTGAAAARLAAPR
jgi:hypothetical protein